MPDINTVRQDKLLSNLSVKYRNKSFIAAEVFPFVPVKKNSDIYRVYSRQFRLPSTSRAIGASSREHTFEISTSSYVLEKHGLKDYIPDDTKDNYDIGDLRADTTEELTDTILRRMEKSFLDLFTTTSWSQNQSLATAALWSANTTVSNPILPVDTATSTILLNSGEMPNMGLIGFNNLVITKNHISILDRVKHTSKEMTEAMLAALFGLEKIAVSKAGLDSAAKGETASVAFMMNNQFWVGNTKARPSLKTQTAGAIFRKNKPLVKRWRDEDRESEVVEVNMQYQVRVISSLSGFLIAGIT